MPSEDTQFRPGQSGNPSGKPKGTKSLVGYLRKYGGKSIEEIGRATTDDDLPALESIGANMIANLYWCAREAGKAGEESDARSRQELIAAFREVANRIDGMPKQSVDNTHAMVDRSITLEDRGLAEPELGEGTDVPKLNGDRNGHDNGG